MESGNEFLAKNVKIKEESKEDFHQHIKVHKISCKNCTKSHHKCDKVYPTCTNCLRKKITCEISEPKKRGRPFGTTKDKIINKTKSNKKSKDSPTNSRESNELVEKEEKKIILEEKKTHLQENLIMSDGLEYILKAVEKEENN